MTRSNANSSVGATCRDSCLRDKVVQRSIFVSPTTCIRRREERVAPTTLRREIEENGLSLGNVFPNLSIVVRSSSPFVVRRGRIFVEGSPVQGTKGLHFVVVKGDCEQVCLGAEVAITTTTWAARES